MTASASADQREQVATAVFVAWLVGAALIAVVLQIPVRRVFPANWYPLPWSVLVAGVALGITSGLLHSTLVLCSAWRSNAFVVAVAFLGAVAGLFAALRYSGVPWQAQPDQYYLLGFVVVTSCVLSVLIKTIVIAQQLEQREI